jgi:sulfotransferase family protein
VPRERGSKNDNYSRLPAPVITAGREAVTGLNMLTAGSRPLPDFLIIGAQRSGTTSLYRYLLEHPQVMPATPSKGVHYFDLHPERSLRWYRAHFPTQRARRARERRFGGPIVTGEGSPYYLFHPHGPSRAAAAVPRARVIAMLRDPVERAYSHYRQEYARGFEDAETFEDALALEPSRLAGERERMLADPAYASRAVQHHAYVARGEYVDQLAAWREHFPAEQMHVICAERFFADPAGVYAGVLRFLGLPDPPKAPGFKAYNARPAAGMAAETRERLEAHYAEPNRRLEEFLGMRMDWASGARDRAER